MKGARAVGCDGILVKPFEPQLVISRVEDLLAGRQPAGMWSSAPPPQGPRAPGASGLYQAGAHARSVGPDPLEASFDQLDAAFSSAARRRAARPFAGSPAQPPSAVAAQRLDDSAVTPAAPPPARTNSGDPLAGWDPRISSASGVRPRRTGTSRATRDYARRCLTRFGRAATPRCRRRSWTPLPRLLSAEQKRPVAIVRRRPSRAQPDPGQQPSPTT